MSEALVDAIENGNVDRLAELLAAGADANATVISRYYTLEFRLTPLQAAVRALQTPGAPKPGGSIDSIVLLLRYGADVNRWDEENETTPLLSAVFMNHIEAVRLLLAHGADPNVRDDEGYSPLRFCVQKSYLEMARLLLLCGATKTIDEAGGGGSGMTALGMAAYWFDVEMVRLLLAHGADPHVEDNDGYTVFEHLRRKERYADPPLDPTSQDRLREIRRLLGEPPA